MLNYKPQRGLKKPFTTWAELFAERHGIHPANDTTPRLGGYTHHIELATTEKNTHGRWVPTTTLHFLYRNRDGELSIVTGRSRRQGSLTTTWLEDYKPGTEPSVETGAPTLTMISTLPNTEATPEWHEAVENHHQILHTLKTNPVGATITLNEPVRFLDGTEEDTFIIGAYEYERPVGVTNENESARVLTLTDTHGKPRHHASCWNRRITRITTANDV